MTPRDRRPDNEQGPVNWGIMPKRTPRPKSASARPGGNGLLEVVRSGNNPAPTGSSASAASSASGVSAASAAGSAASSAGAHDVSGAAVMTEEDLRSAAAQAIASGTADAVDAAIAIDLADVSDEPTGWAGSALSAGSPASPVALRAVGGPADTPGGHGASAPTGDPDSLPASAAGTAGTPSSPAPQQQRTAAATGAESRSPRPVVRPTAVDGPGSAPQTGATTTRVFTISQGKPEAVPSSASTASAASAASVAAAPPPSATAASATPAPAPAAPAASAPSAAAPSARGRGYQTRPSAAPASPSAPTSPAAQPKAEEDAGILAESSAWEAATNALDAEEIKAQGGTDWGVGRGPAKGRGSRRPSSGTDWGVGRGSAKSSSARTRSPWPAAVRRQRLAGVAFALLGLVLATASAMNLARNAEAGHPWIPPWLVAVLGGAGLVAAAGYLAWAGGTPVRREAERWKPGVLDAAAGLTTGSVKVHDPARLVARARGPLLPGTSGRGDETAPTVDSGPTPVMGTSTVDQSLHAPAGVAGAVGGFMLASAVVCAVVALILGSSWLIATAALALGGVVAIRLAGEWLGQV